MRTATWGVGLRSQKLAILFLYARGVGREENRYLRLIVVYWCGRLKYIHFSPMGGEVVGILDGRISYYKFILMGRIGVGIGIMG